MFCPYCRSGAITVNPEGEYVCTSCGTVLGAVIYPVLSEKTLELRRPLWTPLRKHEKLAELDIAPKSGVNGKKTYSELIRTYVVEGAARLGRPEAADVAMKLYAERKRDIGSARPKTAAAILLYMALDQLGVKTSRAVVARALGISKYAMVRPKKPRGANRQEAAGRGLGGEINAKDLPYIAELARFLSAGRKAVKPRDICRDKRCVMRTHKILAYLAGLGLAVRLRKKLYVVEDTAKALEALRELAARI